MDLLPVLNIRDHVCTVTTNDVGRRGVTGLMVFGVDIHNRVTDLVDIRQTAPLREHTSSVLTSLKRCRASSPDLHGATARKTLPRLFPNTDLTY